MNMKYEEMFEALQAAKEALPLMLENCELQAKVKRAQYEEFVKAGFDEKQALELVK